MRLIKKTQVLILFAVLFLSANIAQGSVPVLQSPVNGTVCVAEDSIRFEWTRPQFHYHSRLIIARDANFQQIAIDRDSIIGVFTDVRNLPLGTQHFWKIITTPGSGNDTTTAHSSVWTFTTRQGAPPLVSPDDDVNCITRFNTFIWDTIPGAFHYRLEYSTVEDFADSVTTFVNFIVGDRVTVNDLKYNTKYWWRVRGNFTNCSGYWSDVRTFRTKPAIVKLLAPQNNAQGLPLFANGFPFNLDLRWNVAPNAVRYEVQLSDSANFNNLIVDEIVIGDTLFSVVDTLVEIYNKYYWWRVRAVVELTPGVECTLDWSDVYSFKTPYRKATSQTPQDEQTCVSLEVALTWKPITATSGYTIQLSSNNLFSDTLHIAKNIPDTITVFTLNRELSDYYWRVRAEDANNIGYWSNAFKFRTTLLPPVALSPADSATGVARMVNFNWTEKDTNAVYRLQVADDMAFANLLLDTNGLNKAEFDFFVQQFNKQYYWRIKVFNQSCESGWSDVFTFKTFIQPPVLTAPVDSATKVAIYPTFTWDHVIGAQTYEIQIDTSLAFANHFGRIGIPNNEVRLQTELDENTRYFWRVRASNSEGRSDWSEVFTFKTTFILPSQPELHLPMNAAVKLPIEEVLLEWHPTFKAKRYHLQVTDQSQFVSLLVDTLGVLDTSFTLKNLRNYTVYKWRVRAENEGGFSEWSPVYYFRTINVLPTSPATLVAPANTAINQPVNIKLSWLEVTNAEAYIVQIATDDTFNNIVEEDKNLFVLFKNIYNLNYSTKYYWRVKAWNETGEGPWSEVYSFTTAPFVSVQDELIEKYQLSVYPNPATEILRFDLNLDVPSNIQIVMMDISGKEVIRTTRNSSGNIELNVSNLPAGSYIWSINVNNEVINGKVTISK